MGSTLGAIMNVIKTEQEAKAMEYNAKMLKSAAAQERVQADRVAEAQWKKDMAALSSQGVGYSAGGVEADLRGTTLAVWADSMTAATQSAANVLDQGEVNAVRLRNQARLKKWEAKTARTLSYINVGFAVVADVANMGSKGMTGPMQSSSTQWDSSSQVSQSQSFAGFKYGSQVHRVNTSSPNFNETNVEGSRM